MSSSEVIRVAGNDFTLFVLRKKGHSVVRQAFDKSFAIETRPMPEGKVELAESVGPVGSGTFLYTVIEK